MPSEEIYLVSLPKKGDEAKKPMCGGFLFLLQTNIIKPLDWNPINNLCPVHDSLFYVVLALGFGIVVIGGAFLVQFVGTMVLQVNNSNLRFFWSASIAMRCGPLENYLEEDTPK